VNIAKFFRNLAGIIALASLTSLSALAQTAAPQGVASKPGTIKSTAGAGHLHTAAIPEIRVIGKVDISRRTLLRGHVPSVLRAAKDLGRLAPSTPAQHMVMVLKSSDAQEAALRRVLDEQQDRKTANYHQWVTPDQFGAHFGVHDADIAKVSAWLKSQGFNVEDVSKSKRVIHFSGTTGNLESAFHTEIHSYNLNGETHASNNSDISVPSALSPVIAGVSMHNFFRKSNMGPVRRLSELKAGPNYTSSGGTSYVGPGDFATIYNTQPLLAAGINGAGTSIAVVGRSDILMSDVQSYRQLFNLPLNDPIFIHAGQDNGTQPGDDGESDLDVEISGGIAPQAKVYFVIGTPTFLVDGITNSVEYIVENNLADIMSISYGSCEAVEGAGGNAFNNQAIEQAAAQGISTFVASGDNGPAECDSSSSSYETLGYATGGESSTPYTVSVGGSEFYEHGGTGYWSTNANMNPLYKSSALSYIPETPWNEAKGADVTSTASGSLSGLWSDSGGISAYYLQPSWQRGPGVPTSDPTLLGGNWITGYTITNAGSAYTAAPSVTFTGGGCVTEPTATSTISGGSVTAIVVTSGKFGFGCTSAPTVTLGAPTGTGTKVTATATVTIGPMQDPAPLISGVPHRYTPDLSLNAASGHDGTLFCSEGVCEISPTGAMLDAGIVGGTSVAAPSMAGIQALIDQANGGRQGAPNYIYYALAAAQSTANCNSSLPPAVGSQCAFQDITVGDNLICGTSSCSATNGKIGFQAGVGYDMASGLGSVDAYNLSNLWSTVVFNSSTTTLGLSQTTAIAQGSPITFTGNVSAGSGTGTPTGDVAFILSQGEFGQAVDVNSGAWDNPSPFATLDGNGNYTATLSNLPAGNFTVTARYGGDVNFASSLSAPVAVAVSTGNSQVVITPEWFNDTVTCTLANVTSYNYGQFAWIPATVTSTTGQGVPTGTVTFTVDGVTYGTETLDPNGSGYLAAGTLATNSCIYDYLFAQSPTLPAGVHVIGASYSGDSTFAPATATPVTITVNQLSVTPTLSVGAQNITSGFTVPLVATFTTTALTGTSSQSSGPTGTVTFMDGATTLATATVVPTVTYSAPTYTFAATAVGSTTGIVAPPTGAHSITAVYSGDTNYAAKTSNAATVTVDVTAPVATTTTVTSSANPTTLGGRPTFTATIAAASGTAPASGTVTFYDGGALLGTGAVGSTHTATFRPGTTPAFRGGAHTITAVYGGIAANGPSTSAPFTENVTQGTATITLTAKTVGTASQTYTFAAVLSPSSTSQAYAPILSNVQFYDGATNIGSALAGTVTSAQGGYALWTATLSVNNLTTGSHTITAKYSDTNYSLTTSNAQTVFVAGKPTITWATPAAILAGTALSATQLNATDNIPGTFVYTPAAGTVLTAGTHNLSVTFTPADLADFSTQTKVVPIQVIAPAITWKTPAAISYGTALTAAQLNATANYAGAFTYTPALGTILSAGSQTLSVSFLPTGATTPVVKTVTLQVNTVPLTINVDSKSFTYGGTLPAFTGTVSGLINGDTVGTTITVTYSSTGSATSGAGTYPITAAVTGASSGDYTLTDNAGTLTINKASLTIAENPASGTYGNALPTLSGVVSGNVNGDTVGTTLAVTYSTTASSSSPYSDAGTYPITAAVTGASAGNYNVTDNGGTLTINRANLTLTVNNATGTYGSALPTFTSALGGLTNGDTSTNAKGGVHGLIAKNGRHLYGGVAGDLTITYSTTARSTSPYSPVSTYPITAVLGGAGAVNYNVTVNTPGVLSITPATLTIAENPASGTYGNALPTLSGVVSGTVNGDTVGTTLAVAYSTTASSSSPYSDAGNYPITASVTGTSSGNYTVTDNGGTLTINAASLTITVNNASGTYGSALPTFTSTLSGLTNGDSSTNAKGGVHGLAVRNVKHRNGGLSGDLTIDYSTTANSSSPYSPVGTYPITATLSGAGASNYTVAGTTPGTLTINKATLTIAENAASGTYGNALPALSGVVSGNVNGDTVGTTLAVTYSTTASSSSPYSDAGTYPITAAVTGTSATNYNVTDNGGTLTINPASLTITVNNASGTYGSALPTFTSTLGGLTTATRARMPLAARADLR